VISIVQYTKLPASCLGNQYRSRHYMLRHKTAENPPLLTNGLVCD